TVPVGVLGTETVLPGTSTLDVAGVSGSLTVGVVTVGGVSVGAGTVTLVSPTLTPARSVEPSAVFVRTLTSTGGSFPTIGSEPPIESSGVAPTETFRSGLDSAAVPAGAVPSASVAATSPPPAAALILELAGL